MRRIFGIGSVRADPESSPPARDRRRTFRIPGGKRVAAVIAGPAQDRATAADSPGTGHGHRFQGCQRHRKRDTGLSEQCFCRFPRPESRLAVAQPGVLLKTLTCEGPSRGCNPRIPSSAFLKVLRSLPSPLRHHPVQAPRDPGSTHHPQAKCLSQLKNPSLKEFQGIEELRLLEPADLRLPLQPPTLRGLDRKLGDAADFVKAAVNILAWTPR